MYFKRCWKPVMNLWHITEKHNRMIGTLINSTEEKNELPGQILSFNADESFSKQNKTRQWKSHWFCCFMFVLVPFGGTFIMSEIVKLQSVMESQRSLVKTDGWSQPQSFWSVGRWSLRIGISETPKWCGYCWSRCSLRTTGLGENHYRRHLSHINFWTIFLYDLKSKDPIF